MEEFSQLGGDNPMNSTASTSGGAFIYGSSSSTPTVAPPPPSSSPSMYGSNYRSTSMQQQQQHNQHPHHGHHPLPPPNPFPHLLSDTTMPSSAKSEGGSSRNPLQAHGFHYPFERRAGHVGGSSPPSGTDADVIKAKIISHPQYSSLLEAYMDCQKVGAPPEVVARLTAITRDFEARQRSAVGGRDFSGSDPELDQFMEAYYDMLVKYREELTRPLQEAMDFLRRVESQLNVLTNGATRIFSHDEKCEGLGSSEEDLDGSGGETELPDLDPRAEDKELKHHLLKKYSGYLSNLKQELSKKKKKGKLPKEARQKLLNWWELHYKWPYPSETEKLALAESTGLDQKQINNWFINQRKRHWKPSEDMQFVVMDGYHPQNAAAAAAAAAAFYMDGHHHYIGDGSYRLGP